MDSPEADGVVLPIPLPRGLEKSVIARSAKRAAAIQLDCFVVPQSGTARNDRNALILPHPVHPVEKLSEY
jgi:hypothetical protein